MLLVSLNRKKLWILGSTFTVKSGNLSYTLAFLCKVNLFLTTFYQSKYSLKMLFGRTLESCLQIILTVLLFLVMWFRFLDFSLHFHYEKSLTSNLDSVITRYLRVDRWKSYAVYDLLITATLMLRPYWQLHYCFTAIKCNCLYAFAE